MTDWLFGGLAVLWVVVVGNVLVTFAIVRRLNRQQQHDAPLEPGFAVGDPMPAFSARTLDGEILSSEGVSRGSAIVLFVSPGCGICRDNMDDYRRIAASAATHGVAWVIVSEAIDEATRHMVGQANYEYPVIAAPRGENSIFDGWRIRMTPYFVHFENGRVSSFGIGHGGAAEFRRLLGSLNLELGEKVRL
jgi:peroxiredoxin